MLLGPDSAAAQMDGLRFLFLKGLILVPPLLGLLMISKARYVHLVNRYMRGKRPYTYVAQIVFVLCLLAIQPALALFITFGAYVLLCPLLSVLESVSGRRIVPRTSMPEDGDSSS